VSTEYVRDILYVYDSTCTGCLEFEDYLEFLADYQEVLNNKRVQAAEHYEMKKKVV
jgi:hypothetical protein